MRVAIAGLGAVGGFIAAKLLAAGAEPVALVTQRHLAPLAKHGLRLESVDGSGQWPIRASCDPAALGVQDLIILTTKATALAGLAAALAPMIGPSTLILAAMNGVPWWFFHGLDETLARSPLDSVDPGGAITRALPPSQVLGGVVHLAAAMPEPGLVRHSFGRRVVVGDPLARRVDAAGAGQVTAASPRAAAVADFLAAAGLDAPLVPDIHREVWSKLWGNMTMNPVSAITGATMATILADQDVRDFMSRAMVEAGEVGERIGIPVPMTPEARHAVAARLGDFRTSMLQDVDAGRPVELDAIVGAVIEIAQRIGHPVPTIRAVMGLARLHARGLGLYR
ncbi:MAG: 2-dehydropantoate 2-reductase [Lautropia sp.]